jgi:hypothetical protein
MTAFSLDSYLLLVALIITVLSLFLCIYNVLLLFHLSKKMSRLMSWSRSLDRDGQPGTTGREQTTAVVPSLDEIKLRDSLQEHDDIVTGIGTIAGKYHMDSLVIAMPDGLVVASAGSSDPEYDAAYYSNLFKGDYTMPEQGVWLLPLDHMGVPLIGIARGNDSVRKDVRTRMAEEIELLFERKL